MAGYKFLRWLAPLVLVVVLLSIGVWYFVFRTVPQADFPDMAAEFNYGSIGNEDEQGLPFWIWRVLPTMFPEYLPGPTGYTSLGLFWEAGQELPVGFSKKTIGIERVSFNCAFCHQSSYRLNPDEPSQLVVAGTGARVDPQAYIRFLTQAGTDARFTADAILEAIDRIYQMPWFERQLYRYLYIPFTRRALQQQAADFAWTDANPDWGRGRIDPFNPIKYGILEMGNDGTIGNSDMMPLWDLAVAEGENIAGQTKAVHWDGLSTSLHETVVTGAVGDGMTYKNYQRPSINERIARIEEYVRTLQPPPSPFSSERDPSDPFYIDPAQVAQGKALHASYCGQCHNPEGARYRTVIPIEELGVDDHRLAMWNDEAARRYNDYSEKGNDWGFDGFQNVEGYVAVPHKGLWLRAPYLHNGSVPTLRDMLRLPEERPRVFYRGYDLLDAENGGFVAQGAEAERVGQRFEVELPGNSNQGHLYGTELDPAAKEALLAYLKTL